MAEFLISYWWIILVIIAVLIVSISYVYKIINMPTTEQINKVKEWLLFAVTEAEKELGSGTGAIKLRYVYDKFLITFPFLTKVISFEQFSTLVDEVLERFRTLLESNKSLKDYVEKGEKV